MVDLSNVRKKAGPLALGIAILVLIALLCLVASLLFATRFVEHTIKFVADNIANRSGLSIYLVRGLVIIGTIPFFWSVGKFTKNIVRLLSLGWDSMSLYKDKYGLIIVLYVAVYFLVIYWASLQSYAYKYCADTPEGTVDYDSPGKDPVYGIELKPCSMDQKLALREGTATLKLQPNAYKYCAETPEGISSSDRPGKDPVYGIKLEPCSMVQKKKLRHLKPPDEIPIGNAEQYLWFNTMTGEPLVWYSVLPNNSYRFFDGGGIDPHNDQELKPVTAEIVERIKQQQILQAATQRQVEKQEAEAKRKEDAARDAAAQRAQRDSELAALAEQGQSAYEAKDYKLALETCSQVLKVSDRNQPCNIIKQHASIKLAEQLVSQAQAHFEKGEFDEALWSAEKALDLDPANQKAIKFKKLSALMKPHALQ
jgi:hypothetical protein